jgi:dTDP-4-amino-4,6-dideoxygalactose transaminase
MKIDFARPDREYQALREPIEQAVRRVLGSGRLILGEEVTRFEREFAAVVGAGFAIGVSSGTDALVTALHALEIAEGDEVLVGAFGFVAAPEAVVRVGATPVFVDIEPTSFGLDSDSVARAVGGRTRAIISVDLFGVVQNVSELSAAAPGIAIIEDAAQALGGAVAGRPAGTLGAIGTFSFFPSKTLGAAGDAGACVTDDATLADRMKQIRIHGSGHAYAWEVRGGNYRLDAIQAGVLSAKLSALPARLSRRRAIGHHLVAVAERGGAAPVVGGSHCDPVFAPLALRIGKGRRDQVLARLREGGVDARVHYPTTLAACPPFARFARGASFAEAERATRELISIPCHPELMDEEVEFLERQIARALSVKKRDRTLTAPMPKSTNTAPSKEHSSWPPK